MTTVVLVRHGRTTANSTGVLAGRTPGVRLDETGQGQVVAAGRRLAGVPLSAVVTSPLERCRQTARAIAAEQPGPVEVQRERGLVEVDYGAWTGRALKDLVKEPLWRTVQGHPAGVRFPDGEAMAAMAARSVDAVRRWDATLGAASPDAVWAAVSHGDVIKAILADALGMHLDAFQRIVVDPASISVVRYTEGRPFVLMTNTHAGDLAHLAPPKRGRGRKGASSGRASDAAVGGGAGPSGSAGSRR